MRKFVRNFITEWRRLGLPFEDEAIVAAISGGADSVSLLLVLKELVERKKLKLKITVAHFDHGLRGREGAGDALFVEKLTDELGFDFVLGFAQAKIQNQKGNLEQLARRARYDFLKRTAKETRACCVLTAHTLNDQAETFLLNLLRGSGLDGLAAMQPVTDLGFNIQNSDTDAKQSQIANRKSQIRLVRPLLNWAFRKDTENFVKENHQSFCLDRMNDDLNFARVRIRKNLLPLLQRDYNPKIVETLARTAKLIAAEKTDNLTANFEFGNPLAVKELKKLSQIELPNVLREWLKRERGNLRKLNYEHFLAVARLTTSAKSGRKIELPGGETVTKTGGKLFFEKPKVEKSLADY